MFDKPRKSKSLQILEVLRKRIPMTADFQATYERLHQGYLGEQKFAELLQVRLRPPCIQLYDLQLKINDSECQIDSLLIFQNDIYQLEIKNYQGDFYSENNKWYLVNTKKEIRNPLHQLTRSDLLLREFLAENYSHFRLKSYIIFINPGFQLYQAPLKTPIVFRSQLERFIRSLQNMLSQLDSHHHRLVEDLTAAHLTQSTYEQTPEYNFDQLKKGITCASCNGFMHLNVLRRLECSKCKSEESSDTAVMRSFHDFHLLFPKQKITVSSIETWCDFTFSKRTIARILKRHLTLNRNGKHSYYTLK